MRATRRFRMFAGPQIVAGLLVIALGAVALSLATGPASARSGAQKRHREVEPHLGAGVARFVLRRSAVLVQSGHSIVVRGRLLAAARGERVRLLAHESGAWRVVGRARIRRGGRFHIGYTVRSVGTTALRVSLTAAGRRHASAPAGQVTGLAPAVASWYYDAGNTACGFHATYGVANRTLPCGSKVTISYEGHTVVATVDDRGPFVYGRTFDLNQNTARALGMYGVAEVLASE